MEAPKQQSKVPKQESRTQQADIQDMDITKDQYQRMLHWSASMNNNESMDTRINSIKNFSISLVSQYKAYLSDYTKQKLRNEFFQKLELFDASINKLNKVDISKNHINTKKGKLKDLYIEFVREASTNDELVMDLINNNNIESNKKQLTYAFTKNIIEFKLSEALIVNNRPKDLEGLTQDQIHEIIELLEFSNTLKNILTNNNYELELDSSVRNKIRVLKLDDERLHHFQYLVQIQHYLDDLLN